MKIENVVIVESSNYLDYYPFHLLHTIFEIRCGALRIFEKYIKIFEDSVLHFSGRQSQTESFLAREFPDNKYVIKGSILMIDGSLIPTKGFYDEIISAVKEKDYAACYYENRLGAIFAKDIALMKGDSDDIFNQTFIFPAEYDPEYERIDLKNAKRINYLWDAIFLNGSAINDDFQLLNKELNPIDSTNFYGTYIFDEANILIGDGAKISPFCVLDARAGDIIIDKNANIMPHSTIIGPCYIGANSIIKVGAKIYNDCSIGAYSKIGGELENTIIHSYSNKQHDGFLGHSYICEWVNLGADTNNSDLKNTYGNIVMHFENRRIPTGKMFMGLLCGDHTKSAINSMFTTGTAAGICSVLFDAGFLPSYIPSFTWGGGKDSKMNNIESAIDVAKKVMERRGKVLLSKEEELIRAEHSRFTSSAAL